jgi:hypothetical protein
VADRSAVEVALGPNLSLGLDGYAPARTIGIAGSGNRLVQDRELSGYGQSRMTIKLLYKNNIVC